MLMLALSVSLSLFFPSYQHILSIFLTNLTFSDMYVYVALIPEHHHFN